MVAAKKTAQTKTKPSAKPKAPKTPRTRKPVVPPVSPAPMLPRIAGPSKFTIFNLLGEPRAYYLVEGNSLDERAIPKKKTVAHSVIVVDRSGSMYSAMADTRNTLLKLLTLDEYAQSDLVVTLISYSSQGDATCHFERTPIAEIMKANSKYQSEVKNLRVTAMTCISGGLKLALSKIKPDELTAITVHSDGYANDPSPNSEADTLMALVAGLKDKDAFVNTIAYTDYSDFRLLSKLANTGSGSCAKAGNLAQVYDSLYNSTKLLAGQVSKPIDAPLGKGYDYQVFVSRSAGRINGAAGDLSIRGLQDTDDGIIYKFKKLTRAEFDASSAPTGQTTEAVFAFSRANLADGNLNLAKYALASTFDATMTFAHYRALTNNQSAAFATDLEALVLRNPDSIATHTVLTQVPVNRRTPLLDLVKILDAHRSGFSINRKALTDVYIRRGLKRLQGTRDESGTLVEPTLKTEFVNEDTYLPISSFDVNRNTATMNLMLTRQVRLVTADAGKSIAKVAGVDLSNRLSTFNNYTLIGDGELNIPYLQVKISDPKLFEALKKIGVLTLGNAAATTDDPATEFTLRFDDLPIVPAFSGSINFTGVFDELSRLKVLSSLCAAHLKEDSAEYTPEQVEELKKHYLSKSLYLNFPTTTPYTDLKQALAEGTVDTRTSYKIDIGDRTILNLGKLHSANKFLDRMYEVIEADGTVREKPTFEDVLHAGVSYRHKTLSAKLKVTKIDDFMRGLFDDFLGVKATGQATQVLESVNAQMLIDLVKQRAKGVHPPGSVLVTALTDARRRLDDRSEQLFRERLSPLVFYVGATGLLPDEADAKALTAEQLQTKYPDLTLSKDEKEGTFFELGDTILSVYAKTEYFSRDQ